MKKNDATIKSYFKLFDKKNYHAYRISTMFHLGKGAKRILNNRF